MDNLEHLRFPIGKLVVPESYPMADIKSWIENIRSLPQEIRSIANSLSEEQLAKPYRPEGWTGKQVIHHVADSHLNCLVRVKLALTEDNPTIKPYNEEKWARLSDYEMPISISLDLIENTHAHLVYIFDRMTELDFHRMFTHPQYQYTRSIGYLCALYSWHGKHHTAHLKLLQG